MARDDDGETGGPWLERVTGAGRGPVGAVAVGIMLAVIVLTVVWVARGGSGGAVAAGDAGRASSPSPATTAPYGLERLDHRPGDCLTWDQGEGPGPTRAVTTVACTEAHLIEITGRAVIADGPAEMPTDDALGTLTDQLCHPVDEAHLGGRLDPGGRYYSAGIQPSPESWQAGDREVWCALGARDGTEGSGADQPGAHRPFRGTVAAASQFWLYDRGSCLAAGRRAAVACTTGHDTEIVGRVELAGVPSVPPVEDRVGWDALVGDTCRTQARAYLDREVTAPLTVGWLAIDPTSWSAGQRTAHCVVGQRDPDGGWATVEQSARALPS